MYLQCYKTQTIVARSKTVVIAEIEKNTVRFLNIFITHWTEVHYFKVSIKATFSGLISRRLFSPKTQFIASGAKLKCYYNKSLATHTCLSQRGQFVFLKSYRDLYLK